MSDLTNFSKSLKKIETYIQRVYKILDDIVKEIQNMQHPTFNPPDKPDKASCKDGFGNFDKDTYNMAKFTWKEDYKVVMTRKQRYEENKANVWGLIYNQCSLELRNKLEGAN